MKLVYYEIFDRIDHAFYREKQVQGWSRKKKEALINAQTEKLRDLAECKNDTHFRNWDSAAFDSDQAPEPTGNQSLSQDSALKHRSLS